MPELPEVETVRRVLEGWLLNRKIQKVKVLYSALIENASVTEFQEKLQGETFTAIERYGKYLILKTQHYALVSHLRMEGKYYLGHDVTDKTYSAGIEYDQQNLTKLTKHVHMLISLDNAAVLMYHDTRKFGRISLHLREDYKQNSSLAKLGEEPSNILDPRFVFNRLQKRKSTIKAALLDQSIVAGLGNIYVDETLFKSKIDPREKCYDLSFADVSTIIKNAQIILQNAIENGGTTVRSYHADNHVDGKFQNQLAVYGRSGEPCYECSTPIVKMFIAQRGTHFCPNCQRKKWTKPVRVLGLTGVIGSGKTTVAKLFAQQGFTILDADKYAKEALNVGTKPYNAVVKRYGLTILNTDQTIHRGLLRQQVASKTKELAFLERVIHPYVIDKTIAEIKKNHGLYLLDVPLLFESKMNELCDATIYVHAIEPIRKQRLILRGTMPLKTANDLNKNTFSVQQKMELSDFIIDNSSTLETTKNQVISLKNYLWK